MNTLSYKIALVTGACSELSKAIIEELVSKELKVIGLSSDINKLKNLVDELKDKPGKLYPLQCDLSFPNEIEGASEWIEKNLDRIDNGCIVNMNDICGWKWLPPASDQLISPAYACSKSALSASIECLRLELAQNESNIKVINICPGLMETEMNQQWLKENSRLALKPKDVMDAILYSLQTPENVLIKDLIIVPIWEIL